MYFRLLNDLAEKKKDYSFSDFSEWEFSLDERDDDAPWVDVSVEGVTTWQSIEFKYPSGAASLSKCSL